MLSIFSVNQKKATQFVWVLVLLLLLFAGCRYYANEYTPDTYKFILLWRIFNWAFCSLIFGWYFYKNKKWLLGLFVQLLFMPFFAFRFDLYNWIDYHTYFDNGEFIYKLIYGFGIAVPLVVFSLLYGREEGLNSSFRSKLACFLLSVILFVMVFSGLDKIFELVRFVTFSPEYLKDIFFGFIAIINTLKIVCAFAGFLYLSNRLGSFRKFIDPVEKSEISAKFFKNGFTVAYTLLFVGFLSLGEDVVSIGAFSSELEMMDVISHVAKLIAVFLSARFLGDLIQYRGYTLKKYFGVLNTFILIPLLNIVPLCVLFFAKKSQTVVDDYIAGNAKKRPIHLAIFAVCIIAYVFYSYDSTDSDDSMPLLFALLTIAAAGILGYYKASRRFLPFIVALIYLTLEIKDDLEYYELVPYLKDHMVRVLIFIIPSLVAIYYAFYYMLHKSFYTHDAEMNTQTFKPLLDEFQGSTVPNV